MNATRKKPKDALIYEARRDKDRHFVDKKLREENMWIHYILQSLLAAGSLFVVLLVLRLTTAVIVAALGATAFVVFAMPKNIMAQPRNVVGGHIVGILTGGGCALLFLQFGNGAENGADMFQIVMASISVGLAIFIMVVTDTEHAPGCSTSLGLVVHGTSPINVALYGGFILISATIIALVKHALNPRLKDLV